MKPLLWIGSSLDDVKTFPREVRRDIGHALEWAQRGDKHPNSKPLKGFKGAGVLEVVENHDGDTYRAVYAVKFKGFVYVLHAFQKKSKKGAQTPKKELDLIRSRFRDAKKDSESRRAK